MADNGDPFTRSEPTLIRPRPGGGKRGVSEGLPRVALSPGVEAEPIPDAARALLGVGLNPLLQAATPVLLLAGQMRAARSSMDVAGLRRHALDEIRAFEQRAQASGVQKEIVLAARYALCASLDEAILSTPWGAQSEWAQNPLLVALHREAWGGEKFFEMLENITADPARYIDLMELQYLALAFGFEGKYHVQARGHESLAVVQADLYRKIRAFRGPPEPDLSSHWKGLQDQRNRLIRYVPWWVVGAAVLAILAVTFTGYYTTLARSAEPIHEKLAKVAIEEFVAPTPTAPPVAGPTLKQLLAREEAAGTLKVDEQANGRTVVTLLGDDLFASGSAVVNAAYDPRLQRIAEALNQVSGAVQVIGHTDDQPLRSLRFRNNFDLSRERAVGVAAALRRTMVSGARVSWTGVGSSQPLYRPESDPVNRSRNRRVEIVHLRGT